MGSEAAPPQRDAEELRQFLRPDERALEIRITWKSADPGLRASLIQALEQHGCFLNEAESEMVASLDYRVWKRQETKQAGKVRKLLRRWAERGYLTWTCQRLTPVKMGRRSTSRRRCVSGGTSGKKPGQR